MHFSEADAFVNGFDGHEHDYCHADDLLPEGVRPARFAAFNLGRELRQLLGLA